MQIPTEETYTINVLRIRNNAMETGGFGESKNIISVRTDAHELVQVDAAPRGFLLGNNNPHK